MADENKPMKYTRYAIGEIVLVVIGILIALQINNWNEEQKARQRELTYLENIKTDLLLNIDELNTFIQSRKSCIESCEIVLDYFNAVVPVDLDHFNYHSLNILIWFPFNQHDNTYQELMNSGNLAIMSNKSIKNGLQNMQVGFKKIAFIEGEMQQDFESYLYDIYFTFSDLDTNLRNFEAQTDEMNQKTAMEISKDEVEFLLNNMRFKNGIVLSKYNSSLLMAEYQKMIQNTQELIQLIEKEINR